jgi:hypothetical protein
LIYFDHKNQQDYPSIFDQHSAFCEAPNPKAYEDQYRPKFFEIPPNLYREAKLVNDYNPTKSRHKKLIITRVYIIGLIKLIFRFIVRQLWMAHLEI